MDNSYFTHDISVSPPQLAGNFQPGTGNSDNAGLERENATLKERFSRLSRASLRISEHLDSASVLQEVVDSACYLTGARYGALLTYKEAGGVAQVFTCGMSPEHKEMIGSPPNGLGLLGYLNEIQEPLRLRDIASHPRSIGFPENHPSMATFLGMQIRHRGKHLGNIFLTEKDGGDEFTLEDEEIIVMFATQAATAIANAHRYEEELSAAANLKTLINISPVGVVVFDAKTGRIVSSNREVLRISGDAGRSLLSLEDIWSSVYFRRADGRELSFSDFPTARVLQSGETVRAEEIVIGMPDGRVVETLVNAAPIYSENGEIESVVVTMQDLTPLEDAERLKVEFLGVVSEALRSPLTTIKGSIAALQISLNSQNTRESPQLLSIIDHQADIMRAQINSLVELTHIEAGTLPITRESVEAQALVDEAGREFARTHPGNALVKSFPPDLPAVMADKQRIGQVLRNLLYNASKYSNEYSAIKVSAYQLDVYVVISVSSSEGRMPPDEPPPWLLKLSRIHQDEMQPALAGDRLSLAICKGIVEAHGGRIRAHEGEEGAGITFSFTLLASEVYGEPGLPPGEPPQLPESARRPAAYAPQDRARILVAVEDTRTVGAIRRTLSRAGHSLSATFHFDDVDRMIAEERPHLLLLDLSPAQPEGFEMVHRLSNLYEIPVIVLCGQGGDEDILRAFAMGADDYIVKPFSPTELLARVDASLRKRAVSRNREARETFVAGDVTINYLARTVSVAEHQVQLTATEYKLLVELSSSAGRVLTQDELMQRVWGPEYVGEADLLRSYVKTLRQKLGDNARKPTYIFTEHGIGYRMVKPQPSAT